MTNHYETLNVPRDAGPDAITKAWREAARAWHPDRAPEGRGEEFTAKFRDAREAFVILMDREQRARYDATLSHPDRATGVIETVTRDMYEQALRAPAVFEADDCDFCDGTKKVRVGVGGFWQTRNCPRCSREGS